MSETVTCIIPVHNGAATIERAVDSAIESGCQYVYVFDDSSTDDTKKIVGKFLGYGTVGLSSSEFHVGVNYARNYLISRTSDESLIICLDADDELVNIQPLIDAYEPNTFVYGNHYEICGDSVNLHKGAPIGSLPNKLVTGVTFLFAKEDWKKVGGFDPDFAYVEDYGFMCALVNAGVRGKYVDTTVYNRYLKPEGNERTALAGEYWNFYHDMARRKYPSLFLNNR